MDVDHAVVTRKCRAHPLPEGRRVPGGQGRGRRPLKTDRLPADEVRRLADFVGGPDKLFSRRAMKYRAMGLHEHEVSEDEMLRLMEEEYTFITRPVVVAGDRATAGFSAKRLDALVGAAG